LAPPDSLLRRCALGLWFCAISALGLLRFFAYLADDTGAGPGHVGWTWFGGSVVMAVVGLVLLVRALRR